MEISSGLGLVAVVVLVALNGFFVATEFAVVAARRSKLEQLVAEGRADAGAALDLVKHLDAYLAACQLGITMASLGLGWLGEPAFAHLVEGPLDALVGDLAPTAAHAVAIAASFALITVLHIILGEQVPKMLALQLPEGTTLWVARPMQLFYYLFRWPTLALNRLTDAVLRLVGLEPAAGHEHVHSVEELRLLVVGMRQAGVVEAAEAAIASRAFGFGDLPAGALMTPRTEMEAVPATATLGELLALAETTRHSRLPVYDGSVDDVLGVLQVRDLFKHRNTAPEAFDLRALVRPLRTVPEGKHADDLLEELRAEGSHMALVVDEFGGTAGLVTLEDLVEALVGRIAQEPSAPEAPSADGSLLLDGLTRVDELEELVGARVDERFRDEVETVGGLVAAVLGRFPEVGEEVAVAGRVLRVEAKDGLRVAAVRLLPPVERDGTVRRAALGAVVALLAQHTEVLGAAMAVRG